MKSFTVPRSAVVPLGHNKVPAFGIELGFAGGRFGSDRMHPSNTSVLWRLLAAAFELETPNFFTLKRLDCDLEFSGCESLHTTRLGVVGAWGRIYNMFSPIGCILRA